MLNSRIQSLIATIGVTGFLPYAPGTFGSFLSFLLIIFLKPGNISLLVILLPLFILGISASNHAEKILGKDSGHIVIDEFCGYLISVLFIPMSTGYLLAAFILFRIFDIFKPPPIRRIEEVVPGGAGIMLDDVLAGIYTNACLQIWKYLFMN
ncbi:MAG TPA: phosphatidylglycerophosphatase A [Nitrospirae bacterium]|nr:phosphatidylglycerophosphatase A [Nitrospirota bacterium]HDZ03129.1 phosphatidylglycerophosphatase A [Nitrospirota bacterium]